MEENQCTYCGQIALGPALTEETGVFYCFTCIITHYQEYFTHTWQKETA